MPTRTLSFVACHMAQITATVDKSTPGHLTDGPKHCNCRQINARAPHRHLTGLARADKSAPGHLTDTSQACHLTTTALFCGTVGQIRPQSPDRPLTGLARADKSAPGHLTDTSQAHRPCQGQQINNPVNVTQVLLNFTDDKQRPGQRYWALAQLYCWQTSQVIK